MPRRAKPRAASIPANRTPVAGLFAVLDDAAVLREVMV
jgi:hypothetical protein